METAVQYPLQAIKSPLQVRFWSNYINKELSTFANAYKSAVVAGYTDESARNITMKKWYRNGESFYSELLSKAEDVLLEDLSLDIWEDVIVRGKKTGEKRINPHIARIRSETSKFVCLTIGKKKYNKRPYMERYNKMEIPANSAIDELFEKSTG